MSADAKLVMWIATPIVVALTVALAVCIVIALLYRRRNDTLCRQCRYWRKIANGLSTELRRARSAHYIAETQAAAEMADKDLELRINRELMRQYDRSRRKKEAPA